MPTTEKTQKSALTSTVDAFLNKRRAAKGEGIESEFLNIIEFIDRFAILPNGLFPVQRFILKLYYSIPLDDVLPAAEKDRIKVSSKFSDTNFRELTEVQYLEHLYARGRCNISKQGGRERRELILVLGRRAGKCLDEETLVFTDQGILPLKAFDHGSLGWGPLKMTVAQEGPLVRSKVNEVYVGGIQDVLTITTDCGYRICGTGEHRIKVMDTNGDIIWRHFSDIKLGDFIGIHKKVDLWASKYLEVRKYHIPSRFREIIYPDFLDERWGRLLGVLTGDGHWTYQNSVGVTGGDEEFLNVLKNEFEELFGNCSVTRKRHVPSTCPEYPWTLRSFSKPARKFLHDLGWNWDARPTTKHVPWSIMRSPRSVVAAYLSGLFETDGGMEKDGRIISFSSASELLARQVQTLLINFGITSRVTPKLNRKYGRYYWRVSVIGYESRVIFAKNIGFLTDRKNDSLIHGIANGESGHSSNESVPHQKARLRRLISSIPISGNNSAGTSARYRTWLKEACGNCSKPNSHENPSYSRIRRVLELGREFGASSTVLNEIENIVTTEYFWDPVSTIEPGKKQVMDLSVPKGESYVAAGFTSHNSTLSSIIASYEIYKLLSRKHPQLYYGIPSGSEIRVLCIANDKEQASIVYGEMSGYVDQIDYFKSSVVGHTQTFLKFQTEHDKEKFGEGGKSTLVATFKSSIAKGLRGRGIMCVILDELAFFVDDGKCGKVNHLVHTHSGMESLDFILNANDVDRSRTGWTNINPIGIVQESGRRAIATRIYYGGRQKTRLITTKSRYSIEPTPEHRLKVMSPDGNIEWKFVKDIEIGDFIGINRSSRCWSECEYDCTKEVTQSISEHFIRGSVTFPKSIDRHFGEFLGILVGDGTWNSGDDRSLMNVTGGCEQFLPYVQSHFSKYFDVFAVRRKPVHEHNTCEVSPWTVVKQCNAFREFLNSIGYRLDVTKSMKSVPWVIFKSPKPVVAAFLRGLFETDGGLEQDGRTISFATASKKLAEEVQLLLLNFGITSSVYHETNKNYPDRFYYYLRLIGFESRKLFRNEIGFITERKNQDLRTGAEFGRDASNIIPNQHSRLRRILESIPCGSTIRKGDNARTRITRLVSSSADSKRRSSISYDSARRLVTRGQELGANPEAIQELNHICDTNYFWDPVRSIEETESEVADLLVPDGHEYVAQGMTNHNSSAERVYKAIEPSLKQFSPKDPVNRHKPTGPSEGRLISISSPDAREGFFYRLYELSLTKDKSSSNMLMIQAPTWEVNPTISRDDYEIEYHKDPRSFATEYGAEFSDRVRGWIEDSRDLTECVDMALRPATQGIPREPYWAGVDFGIVNDGTAVSLVRLHQGKVELAYHEIWYAKKSWRESNPHLEVPLVPYAMKLQEVSRLDISEIAEWFKVLSTRFFIQKGVFDQWAGAIFENELHKRKMTQFEMRNFRGSESSQAFQNAKMLMFSRQLRLYDYPVPEILVTDMSSKSHSPLITEMLELQATSGGKNIIDVQAPSSPGKHDDMSDSYVRALLLATEYIREFPGALEASNPRVAVSQQAGAIREYGYHQYHRMRQRQHGGSNLRTVPSLLRRR